MTSITWAIENSLKPLATRALLTWESLESGVAYHPGSDEVLADPYNLYEKLRRKDPIHRMRLIDAWAISSYRDIDAILRDHARFSNQGLPTDTYVRIGSLGMLALDPPDHTRLRALVSRAFTPKSVAALQPKVEQIADDLLHAIEGQTRFNLMNTFAFPLPVIVIAQMLGVHTEDLDRFKAWSNLISLSIEPILDDENIKRARQARVELEAYFEEIIAQRRRKPQADLTSDLVAAEEAGDRLTHAELVTTLILLLVAGNETTRNLIGNGMLALLRNPDQFQRLRRQPDLLDLAIHEFLRYDPPVQMDRRIALEDVEIRNKRIRAGQPVISLIGAANRDPTMFSDPNTLDIGRKKTSHLSFGRGIHYCLGASLAVMEAKVAFAALLKRYASIQLSAEPVRRHQITLRGLNELWVEVERN